jgi:ATP synthase protein I
MEEEKKESEVPKHRHKLEALDHMSLGISMVAAILIGIGIGIGLKALTGWGWMLWLGVFWGLAAAGLNIYKVYKKAQKEFEGIEDDPRYSYRAKYGDKGKDEDD